MTGTSIDEINKLSYKTDMEAFRTVGAVRGIVMMYDAKCSMNLDETIKILRKCLSDFDKTEAAYRNALDMKEEKDA